MRPKLAFVLILAACGGGGGGARDAASPPASGQCSGETRAHLDCASEVKYDATNVQGGFSVAGIGGASATLEQKALRQIDQQTATYIAEARRLCDEYNKCVLDKETYATRSENLRRRLAHAPELFDSVKNAPSSEARRAALSKAYREIVPDGVRTEIQLELSVLVQRPNESAMAPLAEGGTAPTGSRVAFVASVSKAAHLYLFQKSAGGSISVLFPDPRIPIANPVPARTPLRIPQGVASFRLDDKDMGRESVFVVASLTPVTQLAAAAEQARAGGATPTALAEVASIDAGCKSRGLTFDEATAPPQGCVRSRGLTLDDAPAGTRASLSQTSEAGDDTIAAVFHFDHTH
jgi:hypothetical protein